MKLLPLGVVVGVLALGTGAAAQTTPAVAGTSDVYHVHFVKAAPGQAAALGTALMKPDPAAPMPDHFVVLRHQEGDDWDYAVIQHLGQKAAVTAGTAAPSPAADLRAWHDDSFVAGPSWGDFTRQMGIGGSGTPGAVYVLGVQRAVPGHRDQLQKALAQLGPGDSKIQTGNLLFEHLEGGAWQYLTVTRYNSWQDFATDRSAAAAGTGSTSGGWADLRQHAAFHRDTIADRVYPAK